MVNEMYGVSALISALVTGFLSIYCYSVKDENAPSIGNKTFLTVVCAFCLADAFWGFVGTGTLIKSREVFYFATLLFHTSALVVSYVWCKSITDYMRENKSVILNLLMICPLALGIVLITFNFYSGNVFSISEDYQYQSGSLRVMSYFLHSIYYFTVFIMAIICLMREKIEYKKRIYKAAVIYSFIPVIAGVLQYIYPLLPLYSYGYMLAAIAVFLVNVAIEREQKLIEKSDYYKNASRETYMALESLAKSYVSIHLFDLKNNTEQPIYSNKFIDELINEEDNAHDRIKRVMEGLCTPDGREELISFVDTYTLSDRMKNKNMISHEFLGLTRGWCISSFIKVEESPDGELLKVIHSVQSIHDIKIKEAKYEQELRDAYENKNHMYTEILKMEAGGVISADIAGKIYVINDTAANMLGYESAEKASRDYLELCDRIIPEGSESVREIFRKLLKERKAVTFYCYMNTYSGKRAYIMATAKLIKLKNGNEMVITTFADISKNREMEKKLIILSETDALTGINNRGSGESKTEKLLHEGEAGMFCLIDINKFKSINDTFGHSVGDKALMCIAKCLCDSFRGKDIIMRLGGDEFAVFARDITSQESAERVINRLFKSVSNIRLEEINNQPITISLGAAFAKADSGILFDEIYQMADSVMYSCKNLQGNNFVFFS